MYLFKIDTDRLLRNDNGYCLSTMADAEMERIMRNKRLTVGAVAEFYIAGIDLEQAAQR